MSNQKKEIVRNFFLTSLSLKNKNTVYLIIAVVLIFGVYSYMSLPKELFPEVNYPTVFIQTVYPGNSPEDMENLVTRQLEKELKTLKGLKNLSSTSVQDVSMIFVEYNANIQIKDVIQDVKDAVDKAKSELPDDLPSDPEVIELDFSEFPIINLNLSGDFNLDELKVYAEHLQDEIETIYEISKVEIKGLPDKEIQINIDIHKLQSLNIGLTTIENAIAYENMTVSGGDVKMGNSRRNVRIKGEFISVEEIENIIIKHENQKVVYLRDVAEVKEAYADAESYARLNKEPVVSLQVVKKSGENLLKATDQVFEIVETAHTEKAIPNDLKITITNDQSDKVNKQLDNLMNSMIMGIIFVVIILFFFLGLRNALMVGFAIPMSMLLSFVILSAMGATINMIILFGMILALGMLVDNAIVVIENIYRFVDKGYSLGQAAKQATGEIAIPIIASTATTLAAFFPLLFWHDMMGEFMKYLPITLIVVLTSSLFVALVITPVIASKFVKKIEDQKPPTIKKTLIISGILIVLALILYFLKMNVLANMLMLSGIFFMLYTFVFVHVAKWFQNVLLVKMENFYDRTIEYTLRGKHPYLFFGGTILLMLITLIFFFGIKQPQISLFPQNEPQYINVIAELPVGTDLEATDSIMLLVEKDIYKKIEPHKDYVESVLTTVGKGVTRGNSPAIGNNANKGQITINYIDFKFRKDFNTSEFMKDLALYLNNRYPGITFFIEKNQMKPPTGAPINIELQGNEMEQLIAYSDTIINTIEASGIDGIENLSIDIETGKSELIINIEREKARRLGLSTGQIAGAIRTAIFGKEVSKFKVGEDEYPIQLRFAKKYRYNLDALMNQQITFRNNQGKILSIPISAVASITPSSSYGSVKRTDQKRTVVISSNVIEGYNANKINKLVQDELANIDFPEGYKIDFTGEQEDMQKTMNFLMTAMLIAVALILIIMVTQFNSIIKPFIIIGSVIFSTIGVFGGLATFNMDFIVIMTGIGIISLAGVVVNNAIVLVDYIDFVKSNRKKELDMDEEDNLSMDEIIKAIVIAGKTRLRPVLLTAITTILGLIPMATGFNIDFNGLFTEFKPDMYFGGDNATFWGPLSWTVIFGLTFATFLTLVIVPAMYLIANRLKLVGKKK